MITSEDPFDTEFFKDTDKHMKNSLRNLIIASILALTIMYILFNKFS